MDEHRSALDVVVHVHQVADALRVVGDVAVAVDGVLDGAAGHGEVDPVHGLVILHHGIFEAETLEEQFWIESETSGIPLTVQGQDAVLYLNTHRDENSLLWLDKDAGIAFRLDASENEETMLAIAEAVKRK